MLPLQKKDTIREVQPVQREGWRNGEHLPAMQQLRLGVSDLRQRLVLFWRPPRLLASPLFPVDGVTGRLKADGPCTKDHLRVGVPPRQLASTATESLGADLDRLRRGVDFGGNAPA